jgi:hypothetical protein
MITVGLLVVLLVIGLFLSIVNYQSSHNKPKAEPKVTTAYDTENCAEAGCGLQTICNKRVGEEKVEYYEDEELDDYKGRNPDDYTETEISQFREVLLTLKPHEVAEWLNSLCARKVELPRSLRAQAISMVNSNKQRL